MAAIPAKVTSIHTRQERFVLPDGSSVRRRGTEAEIRDPAGRVVVRYAGGTATITAPDGDLCFEAPRGNVRLRAGRDVAIEATGALRQKAGEIDVRARVGRVAVGVGTVLARSLETTASQLVQRAEQVEVEASRIVERSRDTYREVRDLARQEIGRLSTMVRDVYNLDARRTVMTSTEDTEIDGKRVLLG